MLDDLLEGFLNSPCQTKRSTLSNPNLRCRSFSSDLGESGEFLIRKAKSRRVVGDWMLDSNASQAKGSGGTDLLQGFFRFRLQKNMKKLSYRFFHDANGNGKYDRKRDQVIGKGVTELMAPDVPFRKGQAGKLTASTDALIWKHDGEVETDNRYVFGLADANLAVDLLTAKISSGWAEDQPWMMPDGSFFDELLTQV